jgi:hypothetical protein
MWNPTKDEVASIIERCVRGTAGPYEWDDFIATPISNSFLEQIQTICAHIDERFPPRDRRTLTSKEGEAFLLRVASALRSRNEADVVEMLHGGVI